VGNDNDDLPLIYCTTVYIIILTEPNTPLNDADHVGSSIKWSCYRYLRSLWPYGGS